MQSGMQLRLKGERLSGYSVPLTMDLEVLTLLKDVCTTAGHSTPFICFRKKYSFLPTIEYAFFLI